MDDYRRAVPVRSYDELRPWLDAVADGRKQTLTAEPVEWLEPSGGSSGPSKLLPYTRGLRRELAAGVLPWLVDLYRTHPRLRSGSAYWAISPPARLPAASPGVLAAVEAGFARAFCAVADPAEIWFANAEARFAMINAATWVVVAIAYPLLGALLVRHTAPALPMKEPLGAHRLTPRPPRRIPGDRGDRPHAHPAREGAGQRPAP